MRFRGPPPDALATVELDEFVALYHRPSGTTHLLAEPAPQILAALAEPMSLGELHARLAATFALDGEEAALGVRLEELVAAGLVSTA